MTLMSKIHHNFRRAFAFCVAVLQLATLPATYCLHLGCEHSPNDDDHRSGIISTVLSCFSGHHCDCSQHSTEGSSNNEPPSQNEPHDSGSCPVCQAAFATSSADFFAPQLTATEAVSVLSEPGVTVPASAPQYRRKGRGPPRRSTVS